MSLSNQLRKAILSSGASINSLAQLLEIPQPVLHRFVHGQRPHLSMGNSEKVAELFGMKLTEPQEIELED